MMPVRRPFKVLVADAVDSSGIDILRSIAEVDIRVKQTEEEICKIIPEYDALVVRSGTMVTESIIENGVRLRIIGRAGVGVDNVNVDAATRRGIFVVNSPQGNTIAAAEHTLGLMFSLARHIPSSDASIRSGKWEREKFMGSQLQHKTLGIVGLGQVGSHVAKVAREMGMGLVTYDPYVNESKAESLGCRCLPLDELLSVSDFVTLHVPLVPATKHLVNRERLELMKPTAYIINCSRGGVVDEEALCKALQEGRLGGAALDVFEVEKGFPSDSALLNTKNLVLTPHLGASTREAQVNVAVDVAQQIKETLLGSLPPSAVNIPGLRTSELVQMRPILECCEVLGRTAIQLLKGALEEIVVTAEGEFAEVERGEPLLMAAANGAIGVYQSCRVNFVNVKQIAEKHKIRMILAKDSQVCKSGIKVEVKSSTSSFTIRGTITEDGEVLFKAFDSVPVYMLLPSKRGGRGGRAMGSSPNSGGAVGGMQEKKIHLIYSRHDDIPGALAKIAMALGDAGVNIGNCHLGRRAPDLGGRGTEVGGRGGGDVVLRTVGSIPSSGCGSLTNGVAGTVSIGSGVVVGEGVAALGDALAVFQVDGCVPLEVTDTVKKVNEVRECVMIEL